MAGFTDLPSQPIIEEQEEDQTLLLPFYIDNPMLQDIATQFRQPWVDAPVPWRANDDWDYLDQVWSSSNISRWLQMRQFMSITPNWKLNFRRDSEYIDDIKDIMNVILSPIHFDLKQWQKYCWLSIFSGLEAIEPEWEFISYHDYEIIIPNRIHHIDNRRFKYYMDPTASDLNTPRILGIRDAVNMDARSLTPSERANLQIFIYNPIEHSFGYGRGIGYQLYYLWRMIAALEELLAWMMEKYALPAVFASPPDNQPFAFNTNVAGKNINTLLQDYANALYNAKAGGIFASPLPINIDIVDLGRDKIMQAKEVLEFLYRVAGDVIMGSSSIVMNSRMTYGAHRSSSQIAQQFIYDDRDYIEYQFNKYMISRIYELNKDLFSQLDINSIYDMPQIQFLYTQINITDEINKYRAVKLMGYTIDPDNIEESLQVSLLRDDDGHIIKEKPMAMPKAPSSPPPPPPPEEVATKEKINGMA